MSSSSRVSVTQQSTGEIIKQGCLKKLKVMLQINIIVDLLDGLTIL